MKRDGKQVLTELLVLRSQGGDEQAFAELYRLWRSDFARLAGVSIKLSHGVEEIVQDTWVAIAKGLRSLEDPARFRSWAFRILNRRTADWIRRKKGEQERAQALEAETTGQGQPASSQQAVDLSEAIAQLSAEDRSLLHYFYETGLSVNEIAEAFAVPTGTVKSRLFTLREKLKQKLERKNENG